MGVLKRNNVSIYGEGTRPMIFAHGFGCAQYMWRDVWPAFSKDYRIILFDYVGSGNSDLESYNPERYANLNGYAEDILDICHTLGLKDAVFVGHSVSSMIGILAAIKEPSFFQNLILIGPSPRYMNDENYQGGFDKADIDELLETMQKNYRGWANFLAPAMMKNEDRPQLGEELAESFCSVDRTIAKQFAEVTFYSDNRRDLAKLTQPSLIMQCSEDIIAPLEVGKYLHQNLSGSSFRLMEATGHCPHMSSPGETIAIMKEYLQL